MRLPLILLAALSAFAADEWAPARLSPSLQQAVDQTPHQVLDLIVVLKFQPASEVVAEQNAAFTFERESIERRRASASASEAASLNEAQDALTLRIRRATAQRLSELTQIDYNQTSAAAATLGATILQRYTALNAIHLKLPAHALPALLAQPEVAEVFPNSSQSAQLDQSVYTLGAPSLWAQGFTGAGVRVAIFDSGVTPGHPALAPVAWSHSLFLSGNSSCVIPDGPSVYWDYQGHGTSMAAVILSHGGVGFPDVNRLGVAKGIDASLSYKVACLNSSGGATAYDSDVLAALDSFVLQSASRIINFSFASPADSDDPPSARMWDYFADTFDISVVFPAGNLPAASPNCRVMSPGVAFNALTVGNWSSKGAMNSTSCPGPTLANRRKPDLAAPGTSVYSALRDWTSGPDFGPFSGSSIAAAHITGGIALLTQTGVLNSLPARAILINSSEGSLWFDQPGWGYADLVGAYAQRGAQAGTISWPDSINSNAKFFRTQSPYGVKATLAWNRHLTRPSSATFSPTPLTRLSLNAYSTANTRLAQPSGADNENIRQLITADTGPVILSVSSPDTPQPRSYELFALATSVSATPVTGPVLPATCTAPPPLAPGATFSLSCSISNTGGLTAFSVVGSINWPAGFSGGTPSRSYGDIAAGASAAAQSWGTVTAPSAAGVYTIKLIAQSSSYGADIRTPSTFTITVSTPESITPPSVATLPSQGTPGTSYPFSASGGASSLGHTLEYQFVFSDGFTSPWVRQAEFHSFAAPGVYTVRVRARCAVDTLSVSELSTPASITITPYPLPTVPNSGFESGALGPWLAYGSVAPTVSSSAAYSGSYGLSTSAGSGGVYVDFTGLTPQLFYHFTVRVKASGSAHEGMFWAHDGLGSDGVYSDWRTFSTSQWEQLQINFRATQSGMARLHLETRGASGGLLWDDVQVSAGWISDMENGTVKPWIPFGAVTAAPATSPANGLYSLALTGSGGAFFDAVGLVPGRWYHVKARVRASAATNVRLWLHDTQGANSVADGWYALTPGAWQELQFNYQANPMAAMRIHLQANTAGVTTFWDDVQVLDGWRDDFESRYSPSVWFPTGSAAAAACSAPSGAASFGVSGSGGFYREIAGLRFGGLYRVRAKARAESGGTTSAQLRLLSSGTPFQITTPATYPTQEWRPLQIEFVAPGYSSFQIHLLKGSGSTICWDDVEVLEGWKQEFIDHPFDWTMYGMTQIGYTWLTDPNNYSFFFSTNGPGGFYRDIPELTPNQRYHVSAKVRSVNNLAESAILKADDGVGSNAVTSVVPPELFGYQWNLLDLNFTASDTLVLRLFLDAPAATPGLYWDDVEIKKGWLSDFESGRLHPWTPYGASRAYTFSYPAPGQTALVIATAASGNSGGAYTDVSGLQPGRRYQISARAIVKPGGFAVARLWAHDTLGANYTQSTSVTPLSSSWSRLTLNYIANSTGKVRIHLDASRIVYEVLWDDVRLDEGWTSDFDNNQIYGWNPYGATNQALTTAAALGPISLAQTGGNGGSWQDVNGLIPYQDYLIVARSRSSQGATNQSILWVHDTTGSNQIWSVGSTPSPYGWDERRLFYRANSTGAVRLHLANTGGNGTLYWDDIEVVPVR